MLRKSSLALLPLTLLSIGSWLSAGHPADEVEEFWWPQCDSLPGSRMKCHGGKQWPTVARPCGPSEPFAHRYHTNHYWPNPYRWNDRGSVRARIEACSSSGWMTATTLYEQHFDPETNLINEAGKIHLRWILMHTPSSRRTTFVQAGDAPVVSQTRQASAQAASAEILGEACPIVLRVCQPLGTPAQEVDLIRRAYLSSWPVPRIATQSSGSASSGGGSSLDAGEGGP
jgi:hypothetical protein